MVHWAHIQNVHSYHDIYFTIKSGSIIKMFLFCFLFPSIDVPSTSMREDLWKDFIQSQVMHHI